jgi:hypothetical protein
VATIVYLDAEDEITSAASRIRQAPDNRVALVIPFGSRVATSRINFRLLAREAMINGKRLDIVAPDASARALAASAGMPVFASVGEYESALDLPPEDEGPRGTGDGGPAAVTGLAAGTGAAPGVIAGTGAAPGVIAGTGIAESGTVGSGAAGGGASSRSGADAPTTRNQRAEPRDPRERAAREAELDAIVRRSRDVPVEKARRRRPGARVVLGLLVLVVALALAGVAGFLFLPSAEITITPQVKPVGPVDLTVRADPSATAVDEATGVIPAQTISLQVDVSAAFPATGTRVVTTAAKGAVRWKNCDPTAAYTIPRGTVVRTAAGTGFATDEALFLPVAVISGSGTNLNLKCQTTVVSVTAVQEGPAGNVRAGAIRVVPARYNRTVLSVVNLAPTAGGKREEFTRISKKDVEAAMAALNDQLKAKFDAQAASPEDAPAGATVFPETAKLGAATPSVDPATLAGKEVESFTLGLSAAGTVLAVDQSPLDAIAKAALAGAVTPGYGLVDGSTRVVVGEPSVTDGIVTFPIAGSARQLRPVDGAALREKVMGLTEAEARRILEPYGTVSVVLWPGFVTAIPTFDQRVTLTVRPPVDPTPSTDPVPATPRPTEAPSGSSDGGVPSEPLPSG